MNRPTVCHVLHSLNVGGAELLARDFAIGAEEQFQSVFVCLDDIGTVGMELQTRGYPVSVVERRPGFDVRCIRRLGKLLRNQKVNVIHAHQYAPFFYSSLASRLAGRMPVLFTEHGRDYPDYPRWKRKLANKLILRRRDRIIGVGEYVRQALIANEGLPSKRVSVIYNGIDLSSYAPPTQEIRALQRARLGLDENTFAIMQIARLNRLKDHPTAIRAMSAVAADSKLNSVKLFLVGDGEEHGTIVKLVESLGLQHRVVLLGERTDVPELLAAADAFLLSSISEGIPLTLIEAMASELPCIATNVGGNGEVLVDGETGMLVAPGDPTALANAITALYEDKDRAHQMGRAGRMRAHHHFDAEIMHRAYQDLYSTMVRESPRPEVGCAS